MLQFAAAELRGDSRPSRFDAYVSLLSCLGVYDEAPQPQDMAERVGDVCSFIRRDIGAKLEDGSLDTQLIAQALKVAAAFIHTTSIAGLLTEDFMSSILDQSITKLEDASTPKILVLHYLHLLERQRFSSKVLTNDRQERLISTLSTITDRAKGNRVLCHRLGIYQRLASQARHVMISRCGQWMEHLFKGLLGSVRDVRSKAISFGLEAGLHFGMTSSITKECLDFCNRSSSGGEKFIEFFAARLIELVSSKDDGQQVPQIWSVVILCLRSRRKQIEHWEHFKLWINVIQCCLNSNYPQVKFQANLAWNRLIFAINVDSHTSPSMARMLRQPILSQLARRSDEKSARTAKQIAHSTYCTLLYYAFRPGIGIDHIDQYWDLYVAKMLPKAFASNSSERNQACDILSALLFNDKQTKIWNEGRANMNSPTKPEDLPSLDPKWIRLNIRKVLDVFGEITALQNWNPEQESDAAVLTTWQRLMSSLGNAGSKEIKVSGATLIMMAELLNWFKNLLSRGVLQQQSQHQHLQLKKFAVSLSEAVARIGYLPFIEKRLLLNSEGVYEAVVEASSRGSSGSPELDTAASHILALLLSTNDEPNETFYHCLRIVLQIILENVSSRDTYLKILRSLATRDTTCFSKSQLHAFSKLWNLLAKSANSALEMPRITDGRNANPESPGHGYREVVKLLEVGIRLRSNTDLQEWQNLYHSLAFKVGLEVGETATLIAVQEPVAASLDTELATDFSETLVWQSLSLLREYRVEFNAKVAERSSLQLWGVPIANRHRSFNSSPKSFHLIDTLYQMIYSHHNSLQNDLSGACLEALADILHKNVEADRLMLLEHIQLGISCWIEDKNESLQESSACFRKVRSFCGHRSPFSESLHC